MRWNRRTLCVFACFIPMAALAPVSGACDGFKGYHPVLGARFVPEKAVDLTVKGMERAAGRLEAGDIKACHAAIFEYFMNERNMPGIEPWPPRPDALERADWLLEDIYVLGVHGGRRLGRDLGWDENPGGSANWEFNLLAMDFLANLTEAFRLTADKKYIDRGKEAILDFNRDNFDPDRLPSRYSWYDHSVAYRSIHAVDFWTQWSSLNERDERFAAAFMEFIWRHAIYLAQNKYYSDKTNHGMYQNIALLRIAAGFPEFADSGKWRALAVERMEKQAADNFTVDGIHMEFSPSYHVLTTKLLCRFRDDCLSSGGAALSPVFDALILKAKENIVHLIHPDGEIVLFGDSSVGELEDMLDPFAAQDPRFLYLRSGGAEGEPPAECSRGLLNTGFFMMRSGWGTDRPLTKETFLAADFSPWGKAHQHEDFLTFEMSAKGFKWFTDLGTYNYNKEDPGRKYAISPPAHNIVVPFSGSGKTTVKTMESQQRQVEDRERKGFESIITHTEAIADPDARIDACRQLLERDIGDLEDRVLLIMAMSYEELGEHKQEARECLERILVKGSGGSFAEIASQLLGMLDIEAEDMVFDDSSDMEVHQAPRREHSVEADARNLEAPIEEQDIRDSVLGRASTGEGAVQPPPEMKAVLPDHRQQPEVRHWISNGDFDYLEGGFNYCRNFRHERAILFIKPYHFVIVDRIHDGMQYHYRELFHMRPQVGITRAGRDFILTAQDSLRCIFSCLSAPPQASASVIEGQKRPEMQGWYSGVFDNLEAAPVIQYSFTAPQRGDYFFVHAVVPVGSDPIGDYALTVDEGISGAAWDPGSPAPLVLTIVEPGYRTEVSFRPSAAFSMRTDKDGEGLPEISVKRTRI